MSSAQEQIIAVRQAAQWYFYAFSLPRHLALLITAFVIGIISNAEMASFFSGGNHCVSCSQMAQVDQTHFYEFSLCGNSQNMSSNLLGPRPVVASPLKPYSPYTYQTLYLALLLIVGVLALLSSWYIFYSTQIRGQGLSAISEGISAEDNSIASLVPSAESSSSSLISSTPRIHRPTDEPTSQHLVFDQQPVILDQQPATLREELDDDDDRNDPVARVKVSLAVGFLGMNFAMGVINMICLYVSYSLVYAHGCYIMPISSNLYATLQIILYISLGLYVLHMILSLWRDKLWIINMTIFILLALSVVLLILSAFASIAVASSWGFPVSVILAGLIILSCVETLLFGPPVAGILHQKFRSLHDCSKNVVCLLF